MEIKASSKLKNFRIIRKFEFKNSNIIKGISYEGWEKIGSFYDAYSKKMDDIIDEYEFNYFTNSLFNVRPEFKDFKKFSKYLSKPLCYSGGIKNLPLAKKAFRNGADKISINSILFENKELIKEIASQYGSQSISVTVTTYDIDNEFYVYSESGTKFHNIKLGDWLNVLLELPIAEIIIISMRNDGTLKGLDKNLVSKVNQEKLNKKNFLYCGGIKSYQDLIFLKKNNFRGAVISKLFHNAKI